MLAHTFATVTRIARDSMSTPNMSDFREGYKTVSNG